jgi:uncharacterized repeat protein (TIGR04138 family)
MTEPRESIWDAVDRIRATDPRYRREAYGFVLLALSVAAQALGPERREDPERRHLSGAELLESVIEVARQEFGAMAPTVFREWGVTGAADVGEIVFQLVECGQLSARPEDRREDFHGPDLMRRLAQDVSSGVPGGSGERP